MAEAVNDKGVLLESYYRMNLRLVCSPRAAHWARCLQRCSVSGICNILMIIDNQEITRPVRHNMAPSLITVPGPTHGE